MTRRSLLGSLLLSPALAQARRPPNVLMVSVDDMNDWVGCLGGYPGVQTPHIDRLADAGVLFADAHCPSPLCSPSRTAILTGLGPATTGIYNNDQYWRPALPNVVTLPEHFRANGYHVAGAGKVFHHVAGYNPPSLWDEFQLQEFDDPWYRRAEWYPWVKKIPAPAGHPFNGLPGLQGEFDWGVLPQDERAYGDVRAVEWAERFLARDHAKPFFAAVGLWHPHIPLFAPQPYFDLYPTSRVRIPATPADDLDDVPAVGREMAAFRREEHDRIVREGKWAEAVRAYLASVSFADALVGRIVTALDRSAHARDTLLVFWSDNGWHLGEKQHWHKSTLWQRSTHVPFLLRGAGLRQVGQPRRQPVSLIDLYPTLVDLCGLSPRPGLEGQSLKPLLQSATATRRPALITYLPGNHAVCTERWRYIRYNDGGEELYDRVADPQEIRNLAALPQHAQLKQHLAEWMPATSAPPKPERDAYDFDFASYSWKPKGR